MANEGRKQVWVSEKLYKRQSSIARQKGSGPGGCTLVEHDGPDGVTFSCAGGCGFLDGLLGRSCNKVSKTVGGGVQVYCSCSGGWFDSIFG
jgi:hypothetical protein